MSLVQTATQILKAEEGFKENVYIDTEGYPTVGYGIKVGYKGQELSEFREFPPISKELGEQWLSDALSSVVRRVLADPTLSYVSKLDPVRGAVVLSMCYQLGVEGFKKFKKANAHITSCDYEAAGEEMKDSRWYSQVKNRADRHIEMMKTGELLSYYV